MIRTQISLTEPERRALDAAAARTGRSLSALIRDAVDAAYGTGRSLDQDLADLRRGLGAWPAKDGDGATWVEARRSGTRLVDPR